MSQSHLVPCPACNRHVMNDEAMCPFCAAPLPVDTAESPRALPRGRLARAALLAAGASATLIAACSSGVVHYGTPVIIDAGSKPDTADGGAGPGGGGAGGTKTDGTGGGGGAGGTSVKTDAGSVVPLYGAPAPGDGG